MIEEMALLIFVFIDPSKFERKDKFLIGPIHEPKEENDDNKSLPPEGMKESVEESKIESKLWLYY